MFRYGVIWFGFYELPFTMWLYNFLSTLLNIFPCYRCVRNSYTTIFVLLINFIAIGYWVSFCLLFWLEFVLLEIWNYCRFVVLQEDGAQWRWCSMKVVNHALGVELRVSCCSICSKLQQPLNLTSISLTDTTICLSKFSWFSFRILVSILY